MIVLNFAHPLTEPQRHRIEELAGQAIAEVVTVAVDLDQQQSLGPQVSALIEAVGLTSTQWQNEPILVILPSLNFIAALLLAELHGRMGYFPTVVRTRPVADSVPRRYEVAELLNLQAVREAARRSR